MAGQKCEPHLLKFLQNVDEKQHATGNFQVAQQLHEESAGLAGSGDKEPQQHDSKNPDTHRSNRSTEVGPGFQCDKTLQTAQVPN